MVALRALMAARLPLPPKLDGGAVVNEAAAAAAALAPSTVAIPAPRAGAGAVVGRREGLSACFSAIAVSLAWPVAAAILEADDDEELLERVKKDRKKRLERQGVISSSRKETGYLQDVIYKLIKVGQAIDNTDFQAASSLLGPSTSADWVQNVNTAFTKLSSSPEEQNEVDTFNSSLASLFSAVGNHDIESSKVAFSSSANALEKWIGLTGLEGQLKSL